MRKVKLNELYNIIFLCVCITNKNSPLTAGILLVTVNSLQLIWFIKNNIFLRF